MIPSREQLIEALYREYDYLCHDDFDPDLDATPEEYLEMIKTLSYEDLVLETSTDEEYTLEDFLSTYGESND
jgi:hypothetical protein